MLLANPDITVGDVADRLGVSPATLYRYLPAARTANAAGGLKMSAMGRLRAYRGRQRRPGVRSEAAIGATAAMRKKRALPDGLVNASYRGLSSNGTENLHKTRGGAIWPQFIIGTQISDILDKH